MAKKGKVRKKAGGPKKRQSSKQHSASVQNLAKARQARSRKPGGINSERNQVARHIKKIRRKTLGEMTRGDMHAIRTAADLQRTRRAGAKRNRIAGEIKQVRRYRTAAKASLAGFNRSVANSGDFRIRKLEVKGITQYGKRINALRKKGKKISKVIKPNRGGFH